MRILCVFGRHNYGDPARGEGVEYTHFPSAFSALGHEVEHFESFSRATHTDFASLNRALLERVEAWQPDVVFTVLMMAEVWLETIALMRRAGCRVVNWATDDSWKYRQFSRLIAPDFDLWATTCTDALARHPTDGIGNIHATQWAASSAWLGAPKPAHECCYAVTFVGSAYGGRPVRIAALREAGIAVECFGHGWPNGPVTAERIPEIIRDSVVSLNFSEAGHGGGQQLKARVFEVPAAGGMLLTEAAPHLDEYFVPGKELLQFGSDGELIGKTRALLSDPVWRDALTQAGHARTCKQHTYESRFRDLLAHLEQVAPVTSARKPIDWRAFESLAHRHAPTFWLRLLHALLTAPCLLIWGRHRGRRAARRILFEASWRLFGRHTYTSAGWPGRLFYRES